MFTYDHELESHYTARIINLNQGKKTEFLLEESVILTGTAGCFFLKSGEHDEVCIKKGEMVFIHAGFSCKIVAAEKCEILMLIFPEIISLCNSYIPEVIEHKKYTCEKLFYTLSAKRYITLWVQSVQVMASELNDYHPLMKTKVQELFLMLKICYSKDELSSFLCPVFAYNYEFTLFILNNFYKVKTVGELAELSSLSLSGFEKEFRKVFDTSPYRWMLNKKTKKLFHEISATDKLFKVIAEEYEFVSLSQLGDFCRKHFGASPREIRNKKKVLQ